MKFPIKKQLNQQASIDQVQRTSEKQEEILAANDQVNQDESSPSERKQQQQDEQNQQEPEQQQRDVDGVTIFCHICQDFIAHSVTTTCEHTFCELCLTQYMIYIDECPQCGARIRHQRLSNNILLDNLILDYIKKYEPDDVQIYNERMEKFKTYQKDKKLNDLEAGMRIDVRDTDYVWCTGKIYRTVNKLQEKKMKWMIVKYDKSNKKEEFPQNSPRIAPLGFYTGRKDIPKYYRGKLVLQNEEENVVYTIPNNYDEEEEKQQE